MGTPDKSFLAARTHQWDVEAVHCLVQDELLDPETSTSLAEFLATVPSAHSTSTSAAPIPTPELYARGKSSGNLNPAAPSVFGFSHPATRCENLHPTRAWHIAPHLSARLAVI
jgi:hypothetical protein